MKTSSAHPKSNDKPNVPIAITCRCGNQIVLEPRWIGKPSACGKCEATFVASMVTDVRTGQRMPHVRYMPVPQPQSGGSPWVEGEKIVTCHCGARVAVDQRHPRNQKCPKCGQLVAHRPPPAARESHVADGKQHPAKALRGTSALSTLPTVPGQMQIVCSCGETLGVPSRFYDRNMYCAACGTLMHLRLVFEPQRKTYELIMSVLDGHTKK